MVNWSAIGAVALPFVGGFSGSMITHREVKGWYGTLNKPKWTPPDCVFPPVWSALYASMGYASYRVFDALGGLNEKSKVAFGLYGANLLLNWAWSPIFFGAHSIKWGLAEILALDVAATATAVSFYNADKTAGLLFLPYLAWLALATSLVAWIWKNNDEEKKE